MKKWMCLVLMTFCFANVQAQSFNEPWNPNQLMTATVLANKITQNRMQHTVVINIGPDAVIKNSYNAGPANDAENITKLKKYLSGISKDKEVVIYCGCCPFDICPNIRPAFKTLQEMGFTNAKLLNIPKNIKTDWIDKGFPVNQ
ncbi:MAG TPA: hypothetical protein VKY44_04165 [Flavobacterium sp.]|nr:hypothetical protein [Flavobacterium sp.]